MRRFENRIGNHFKFWEVDGPLNGLNAGALIVRVRCGRIGTDGQVQSKVFTSSWRAEEFVRDKIDEKLGKGYVERPQGVHAKWEEAVVALSKKAISAAAVNERPEDAPRRIVVKKNGG